MASEGIKFEIKDNSEAFKAALKSRLPVALEAVGIQAEGYAKAMCPVDTGRLRNSISHAVSQETAYIGTNVEYAPYVELGTYKQAAKPYLKPAVANHTGEYKRIIQSLLQG